MYEEILPIVDKMYVTEVDMEIEGDTFFPKFNEDDFLKEVEQKVAFSMMFQRTVKISARK